MVISDTLEGTPGKEKMKYERAGVSDAEIRIPCAIAEHALTLPKQPVNGFSPFGQA
jgi:hypothetical protein